jgi:hypothetical protein
MKKLIIAFAAIVLTANVQAQMGTTFSLGLEADVPVGTFNNLGYKFGIGGSAQVDHKIATDAALTLNVGYINHANKSVTPSYHYSVIPVLAGVKYWFSPKVYGSAQLGAAFNSAKVSNSSSSSSTSTGFAYSPGIGFNLSKNIDMLVKYFGNSVNGGTFGSVGARLAYNFGK